MTGRERSPETHTITKGTSNKHTVPTIESYKRHDNGHRTARPHTPAPVARTHAPHARTAKPVQCALPLRTRPGTLLLLSISLPLLL